MRRDDNDRLKSIRILTSGRAGSSNRAECVSLTASLIVTLINAARGRHGAGTAWAASGNPQRTAEVLVFRTGTARVPAARVGGRASAVATVYGTSVGHGAGPRNLAQAGVLRRGVNLRQR